MALLAAAAGLRLASLGSAPFTVGEASVAADAAQLAGGAVPDGWTGSLQGTLTSLVFRAFGETEALARLVPGVAGVAAIAVFYAGRGAIGRVPAVVAGALLATSPLMVLFARSAEPYAMGALLSVVMAVCLAGWLKEPRSWLVYPLMISAPLAPLTDTVAVTAAIGLAAYLAVEAWSARSPAREAWREFRVSPLNWLVAAVVVLVALQLAITHLETTLDRNGFAGIEEWTAMFRGPRDMHEPEFHLALLLGYEWPLLAAGTAGFAWLAFTLILRRGWSGAAPIERLAFVWTAVAALTLALVARHEAGQLLLLLPPLAICAGLGADRLLAGMQLSVVGRWWPVLVAGLLSFGYAALLMTELANGNADDRDRTLLVLATAATIVVLAVPVVLLRRQSLAVPALGAVAVAAAFLAHSATAVAFQSGFEFAAGERLTPLHERFRDTVETLAAERDGRVTVDPDLAPELRWTLRDSPADFSGDAPAAAVVVASPDAPPDGFTPAGEVWRLTERWYPESLVKPRSLWRWVVYRESYGAVDTVEAQIYVPSV